MIAWDGSEAQSLTKLDLMRCDESVPVALKGVWFCSHPCEEKAVSISAHPIILMKSLSWSSALFALLFSGCHTATQKEAAPVPAQPSSSAASPTASSGTVTTASGLKYHVITSGPAGGTSPTRNDTVVVHYHGTLTDGTVFDSSYQRGEPATFGVGQVIAGWTEALQLMKPGDKWLLHIPAPLAYGSRSVGGKIPPNSDLIFQVELLQIIGGR